MDQPYNRVQLHPTVNCRAACSKQQKKPGRVPGAAFRKGCTTSLQSFLLTDAADDHLGATIAFAAVVLGVATSPRQGSKHEL
jgi:hypothetical protein